MESLQKTQIGLLNKDSDTSSPEQITAYINSIISADSVALGGGLPDINTKTMTNNKTQNSESVVIGKNANNTDINDFSTSVVAIGANSTANNWGTAIGVGTKAYLGMAFGADAWAGPEEDQYKDPETEYEASPQNAVAIGRYAKSTASGAIQLGGQRDEIDGKYEYYGVNNDKNSLKFYVGGDIKKNITVVHSDGTISADVAVSCSGTADNANALNDGATLGTTIKIDNTLYTIGTTTIVDASSESKTVLTLTPVVY